MSHTPGPWEATHTGYGHSIENRKLNIFSKKGAVAIATFRDCPLVEAEANAMLMAAAPDMFAVLKAIVGEDNPPVGQPGHVDFGKALSMACVAIRKARGE